MAQQHQHLILNLQEIFDRTIREDPAVHGGILLIDAPDFNERGKRGDSTWCLNRDNSRRLVCAASITTMRTATGCMLFVEEGRLELDSHRL
jgi:hypothetical protein